MTDFQAHPVEIVAEDGVILRGQRWGTGPDWIILIHDAGEDRDLDDWRPLLPAIMALDRTLLTIDLRGHGASDGGWDETQAPNADIATLIGFARANGATWIALAAAGGSATEILKYSSVNPIDASVLLSPVFQGEQASTLRGRGEGKLFAVGSRSEQLNNDVRQARNRSIGWAMLVSMPTDDQGIDLLTGPYSSQLVERIVTFLGEQRMLTRHSLPKRGDAAGTDTQ